MELFDPLAHQPLLRVTLAIVLGLLVGSFINVVVHRLPLMLQRDWRNQCLEFLELDEKRVELKDPVPEHPRYNLSTPASHCPRCHSAVRPWQNIPVLSYLLLRGRCGSCQERISQRYPLVEASSAVLVALLAWTVSDPLDLVMLMLLTWGLLALSLIDFDHQLLPDDITLPLLWLGLVLSVAGIGTGVSPTDAVLGAALGYMTLWSVYWLFRLATGREGMGYGDFKLLAALGAWLGWQNLLAIVLLSSMAGTVIGFILILLSRGNRNQPIPFGPYLAVAGYLTLLLGDLFRSGYQQFIMGLVQV